MTVEWVKCMGNVFCGLETVDLSAVAGVGVYVIWQNPSQRVIYVGEGQIADRLGAHRNDPTIVGHRGSGSLLVTWTAVQDDAIRWGIERYLGELWRPLVSKQFHSVQIVEVNLPR